MKIAPSILSCDFSKLKEDIDTIANDVDMLHIDVMDGIFVNNISFGAMIQKAIRPFYKVLFDTHLMILHPLKYIEDFYKAGSDNITFHLESEDDPNEVIAKIHSLKMKSGISIKPKTEVKELIPYLDKVDLVLIMSVEPGFGGQAFDDSALAKIKWLKEQKALNHYSYEIEVDGGINDITGSLCKDNGAEILVSGSYIFKADNRIEVIKKLKA